MGSHYLARDGQIRMAEAVARTIVQGGALVVEAGTGVGKTFAYLVPALLSGERVLLSTATKALQDMGMENVAHIDGGFGAWVKAGAPTETLQAHPANPGNHPE